MIHFNIIHSYLDFFYSVISLPILGVLVYMNFLSCDESYMSQGLTLLTLDILTNFGGF